MPRPGDRQKAKRRKARETPCGEAITALREKAGLTVDAVTMGRYGEGTVSKGHYSQYERGTLKPKCNTLTKILDAIQDAAPEKITHGDLLKVRLECGCDDLRLPDEKAVAWAQEIAAAKLEEFPGPAYLLKCGDIPLDFNRLAFTLFGAEDRPELAGMVLSMPIHDLLFDPKTRFIDFFEDRERFLWHNYCTTYQYIAPFRGEGWCADFVNEIATRYGALKSIWREIESSGDLRTEDHADYVMQVQSADGAALRFHRGVSPLRDVRFYLVRWHAADGDTLEWVSRRR